MFKYIYKSNKVYRCSIILPVVNCNSIYFQVACIINKNSPDLVNDLMTNLKIGRGNSEDDIGFHITLNVLEKLLGKNQGFISNNLFSCQNNMTPLKLNPQNVFIHLNKSDFINDVLKSDVVDKTPQPHSQTFKPRIIEFR